MKIKRLGWQAKLFSLGFLLIIAGLVRLYRIGNPLLDWHAFRQADTASVTREYVKNGVDLLRPTYHDHSNIQSGQDNPEGYRMVEFPLVNVLLASILRTFPALGLTLISRLASVAASLGTLVFLYRFTINVTGEQKIAWLAGLFYALLPYSIYYSRVVLPEPFLLLFSMGSLYWLTEALQQKKLITSWQWWASAVSLGLAFLLKPFVSFLAPLFLAVIWQARKKHSFLNPWWLLYGLLAIGPLWWWRAWIEQFPSGIPASDWLFNSNGIRFRPAWFRWLFFERFTKLILGFTGVLLAAPALIWSRNKTKQIIWSWSLGLLAYLSIIATGNVQHDYYQVIFVPLISFVLGAGFWHAWQKYQQPVMKVGLAILAALMLVLSWRQIAGYFNVNHWEYVEAGQAVDRLTPTDAKIIAPAFGDTMFLFQTNRTGWPIGFEIADKISKGADYYVTTSYDDEARELEEQYQVIEKTDLYLLIKLEEGSAE